MIKRITYAGLILIIISFFALKANTEIYGSQELNLKQVIEGMQKQIDVMKALPQWNMVFVWEHWWCTDKIQTTYHHSGNVAFSDGEYRYYITDKCVDKKDEKLIESQESWEAFNGDVGFELLVNHPYEGGEHLGNITPRAEMKEMDFDDAEHNPYYFCSFDFSRKPFVETIREGKSEIKGKKVENDTEYYIVETFKDKEKYIAWIDSQKNFSIFKIERYDSDGKLILEQISSGYKEYVPGLWLPKEIALKDYSRKSETSFTIEKFDTEKIPEDEAFTIKFPPRTLVVDDVAHLVYIIGEDGKTKEKMLPLP